MVLIRKRLIIIIIIGVRSDLGRGGSAALFCISLCLLGGWVKAWLLRCGFLGLGIKLSLVWCVSWFCIEACLSKGYSM